MTEEPELTAAERRLLDELATGETVNFSAGDPASDDPAGGAEWSAERTIRGEILARFLAGEFPDHKPHWRGVVIVGARISGILDLCDARLGGLMFRGCYVENSILLQDAHIDGLYLLGSRIAGLNADRITVRGSVFLRDGFYATGEVRLLGADIGGNLECIKGKFENPKGRALSADGVTVQGSVFLQDGFHAIGEVRLLNANIGGNLECTKGKFENPKGNALNAERITVRGSVFLRDGFHATGEVRLLAANIGSLVCANGYFKNPKGHALSADGVTVQGSIFLKDGFHATGEVRLLNADIGGNLECTKGKFENPKGRALSADGVTVKGDVCLRDGFHAIGEVLLPGANIGGDLTCANGEFSGDGKTPATIILQNARIKDILWWTGVRPANGVRLDLRLAHVGTLVDDPQSWPGVGRLFLDGLTYDRFGGDAPTGWEARRDWLGRQPRDDSGQKIADAAAKEDPPQNKFRPQPHEQLVKVLRVMGHDRDARRIAIDKQRVLRARGDLNRWEKAWNRFLDVTIRYGYAPQRVLWFLGFVLLGTVIFCLANDAGIMAPTKESTSKAYPVFYSFIYSVDTFLPIVDLHQEAYWLPNANQPMGVFYLAYLWLHIGMGWIFTTLAVIGFTGLVKKE